MSDLAKQLGREDGSLREAVKRLHKEKALKETRVPHSDAVAYELTAKGRRELAKVIPSLAPPGLLTAGQDLFLISIADLDPLADELERAMGWPGLVWLGRLYGGPMGVLAAFDAQATPAERDAFARMLKRRGIEHWQLRLDWVMEPLQLAQYATASKDSQSQLGPGGESSG